jgi:hypothetical protein
VLVGAAFLGALSDAMLLGHWYLVQPGLPRRLLNELVRAVGIVLPLEVAVLMLPTGMWSVLNGTIDDGWNGTLGWFWLASAVATGVLVVVTRAAFVPGAPRDGPPAPLGQFYNNHNSNAAAFHRIRAFRALALKDWAVFQGGYSGPTRRASQREWPRITLEEVAQWAAWPWRAERSPLPA